MQGPLPTWVERSPAARCCRALRRWCRRVLDDFDATTSPTSMPPTPPRGGDRARRRGLGAPRGVVVGVRPGCRFGADADRARGHLHARQLHRGQRVRHRRRAQPEDRRVDRISWRSVMPHYVVVEFVPFEPTRTGFGPGTGVQRDRRQPAAPVRAHGARTGSRRAAGAGADGRSGAMFGACCYLLHRRDARWRQPRRARHGGRRLRATGGAVPARPRLDGAGGDLVVLSVFAEAARPRRPSVAKSAPYECGIVPSRNHRALPGAVLRGRDAVRDVRHRDHLPLPYAVSHGTLGMFGFGAIRCSRRCSSSPLVYESARGGLRLGPDPA